ncbi:MAG: hypothetical protein ACOC00_00825 [Halothiobacillaceae bacterium]
MSILPALILLAALLAAPPGATETLHDPVEATRAADREGMDAKEAETVGTPDEILRQMAEQGRLTVRALIAYDRLPERLRGDIIQLRSQGVDVLGADARRLEQLLTEQGERLDPEQGDALKALLETLKTVSQEPTAPSGADDAPADNTSPPPAMPPMQLPAAIDLVALGEQQYAGLITTAQEATRALAGPMTQPEETRFEERWNRYRAFPSARIEDYFRAATPLLAELVQLNESLAIVSAAFDEAWAEAMLAATYESERDTAIALSIAARQRDLMRSMQQRADEIAATLAELGDPPDPEAEQEDATRRHANAVDVVRELVERAPLEGVWIGHERVTWVGQEGDGWIDGILSEPLLFVVYNAGRPDAPSYRALLLNNEDPEEVEQGGDVPYVDFLPIEGDDGDFPSMVPAFNGDQLAFFHTVIDEDGDQWAVTAEATRVDGRAAVYPTAVERQHVEQAFEKTLARIESERAQIHAAEAERKQAAESAAAQQDPTAPVDAEALFENVMEGLQGDLDQSSELVGLGFEQSVAESTLQDFHRQYRWTGPFLQAAGEWLRTRPFDEDGSVEADRRAFLALLKPQIARVEEQYASASAPEVTPPVEDNEEENEQAAAEAAEQAAELQQARVGFHEANIRIIQRNVERDRTELAEETDPDRRAQLQFRIVTGLSDIQSEQDRIESIRTGETVHSRTAFDDYAHDGMIHNIRKTQQEMQRFERSTQALYRLASMMPDDEAGSMRAFIDRQLTPEVLAQRDQNSLKRIAEVVGKRVQGYHQQQEAAAEEEAAWAMLGEDVATNIKTASDQSLMVLSMVGGQPVEATYLAVTGYVEGGPAEAAMRAASSFGGRAAIAVEALRGYQDGGLEGAAKRAAVAYAMAKGMEYGMSKVMARATPRTTADAPGTAGKPVGPLPDAPDAAQLASRVDVDEQRALATFKRARKQGEELVSDLQQAQARVAAAGAAGRPAQEILELQGKVRAHVAAINGNPHAKNFLKYRGASDTQKVYKNYLRSIHDEVETRFHQRMKANGWDQTPLKEMRNASSGDSVGMDFDIGLDEAMVRNLRRGGKPASGPEWQVEASKAWAESYEQVTGHRADLAWENITTPTHPESYRDITWLSKDKSAVSRAWGQQGADVSRYKNWHMMNDPNLSQMEALQEVSRGTAKDIQSKLAPMLDGVKPRSPASAERMDQARQHWQQVQKILADFGDNTIDPVTADRRIRALTGGKDIPQVADEMAMLLESVTRFADR